MIENELMNAEDNKFQVIGSIGTEGELSDELLGLDGSFEKVKIPLGGGLMFELPGINPEEPEMVKEFKAVILHHHPFYSYYKDEYTGTSNPPSCGSFDGIIGQGDPGGKCSECEFNQFGSGKNGSKACKNRRRLFLLRENDTYPVILSLPTSSLKEFSRYVKRLVFSRKKSNSVVTTFSLKRAVNTGGIAYSQLQFKVDRDLNSDEFKAINATSEQIKLLSKKIISE